MRKEEKCQRFGASEKGNKARAKEIFRRGESSNSGGERKIKIKEEGAGRRHGFFLTELPVLLNIKNKLLWECSLSLSLSLPGLAEDEKD